MFRQRKAVLKRSILLISLLGVLVLFASSLGASRDVTATNQDFGENPAAVGATQSYIVVMEGAPLVAQDLDLNNTQSVQNSQNQLKQAHDTSLEKAGASTQQKVHDYTVALNGYSAILTEDQVKAIEAQDGVVMVMEDQMRYPTTENSPAFLGLTAPGAAWAKGFDGEGVVVGVIDTGIWPEHPSFADDGSYAAPPIGPIPCEFGNTAHHPDDAPFTCNNKLIGARQMLDTYRAVIGAEPYEFDSARDDNGHGTHTASTAAGNAGVEAEIFGISRGAVSGIAPRAHVVAYKGLGDLGGFTSDLAAAIDQAVLDGVDVINYSIGGGAGLPGADEIAFLFAADAGVHVATSAGNSGPGPVTLGNPGTMPWLTTVGASTQDRSFIGSASSSDGWEFPGVTITGGTGELPLVDAEDLGNELCDPNVAFSESVVGKIVLCMRGVFARAAKSQAVYNAGGAGMILYNQTDTQSQVSDNHWVPSVHTNNTDGLAIKAYIDSAGATAVAQINGGVATTVDAPWMASFSSRGPNAAVAPDLIKPDITAPGVQILAGASPIHAGADAQGQLFQAIAGTSMSSPHVAGVLALIDQAHPDWTPAMAKSAIMTTAYQDVMKEDGVTPADPFDMGAGHLDPGGRVGQKGTIFNPGLVYDAGLFEYAAFTCGMDWGVFTPGSCDFLESIGVPSDPSDLNVPSIGIADLAGSQTVQRTVTMVGKRGAFRVSVEEPPGYDVSVSPEILRLNEGESATFYVTITSNGAVPPGEWSFGSLTWGAGYNARIPLAVKGALFDAPLAVSGSGTDGDASFDVLFGYTGDYAAAPHGLTADAPTSGEIYQDPDQTYPSADDTPAGVQRIDYTISGAAFARWELVIPGDDDIDLFLEDSSGTIIASSTSGGTDELVELVLPADDTYTMVVHGWSVPNEPLPYTLHYWEVPLASGGSLSVDSAPSSATVGTTGTIDVSWSGLSAGTRYLGAVSHSDDAGLLGLTLVEVDTQ